MPLWNLWLQLILQIRYLLGSREGVQLLVTMVVVVTPVCALNKAICVDMAWTVATGRQCWNVVYLVHSCTLFKLGLCTKTWHL
jgi:hypothetical protein